MESIGMMKDRGVRPVVKWAGGKRRLLPVLRPLIGHVDGTWFEPFLGGAAVFLDACPERAVLNDANPRLMAMYRALRDSPVEVADMLEGYADKYTAEDDEGRRDMFLEIRDAFNAPGQDDAQCGARLIFLNRTCFNGLYRENSRGGFNSPWSRVSGVSFDTANIMAVSGALKGTTLICGDFAEACADARRGDTVFLDPPYDGTFDAYVKGGFGRRGQERVASLFAELAERGCRVVLTNADTPLTRELYEGYDVRAVPVRRMINRDASRRTGTEIVVAANL